MRPGPHVFSRNSRRACRNCWTIQTADSSIASSIQRGVRLHSHYSETTDKGGLIMLLVGSAKSKNCQGVSRRAILRVGGLSILGLTLPDLWRATAAVKTSQRRDVSCIFLWLDGGP